MFQYDMLARSLAAGNGFRWYSEPDLKLFTQYVPVDLSKVEYDPRGMEAAFRGPMYPIFLAMIYFLSGLTHRFFAARLVQAFLGAMLAPMTFALARRLDPERKATAHCAAWIVALYPILALYPLALATENLFFVLCLGGILLLLRATDGESSGGKLRWYALAGFVLGMAVLTRSVVTLFLLLAAYWIARKRKSLRGAVVFLAAAGVMIAPWALRNSILAGRPENVEVSLGYNLYMGYHPKSEGTFLHEIATDLLTIFDDMERDRVGTQKAIGFIRADPGRVPYLVVRKAGFFFGLERRALQYFYSNDLFGYIPPAALLALALIFLLPFVLLAPSAAFGAAVIPRSDAFTLVLLFFLAYIPPHMVILAEERFHMVLIPFLAVLAAAAVSHGREILSSMRDIRQWKLWLLPLVISLLLLANWGFELLSDSHHLAILFGPGGNTSYFPY
jgi:4-amino-4-deoxy-L-arabinose transferase-like glycosyltransferase